MSENIRQPEMKRFYLLAIFATMIVLLIGAAFTFYMFKTENKLLRTQLINETRLAKSAVNLHYLKSLTGTQADIVLPDYIRLKEQLTMMRAARPLCRFTYIVGQKPDGTVFFFLDSESPESPDNSPPGQIFTEASVTLKHIFSTRQEITEGPVQDRWGKWVSGFVPIVDPKTNTCIAVFGMDVDARNWNRLIIENCIKPILATLLLTVIQFSIIIILMYQRTKREKQLIEISEAALRESEEKFRALTEETNDIIYSIDVNGIIEYMGPQVSRYNINEIMVGRNFIEFVHPEDQEQLMKNFLNKLDTGEENVFEFRILDGNGNIRWIEEFGRMHRDETGAITGSRGVLRDITGRKQAEEEQEKILLWQKGVTQLQQSLLEPSPLNIKLKNITDGIVRVFGADFCRIWLIRPGDMCESGCIHAQAHEGQHICSQRDKCLHLLASSGRYTHTDGESHCRVPFGCYKIGRIASGENHRFITNDAQNDPLIHNHDWVSELGLVSFAGYKLDVPGGKMLGIMAFFSKQLILPAEDVIMDGLCSAVAMIIQQAIAEEERRLTEEKYWQLFNEAPIGYQELDLEGKIVRINKTEADMMGYTIEEMVGKPIFDFISPDQLEEAKNRYKERLHKDYHSTGFERKYTAKSGEKIFVSIKDKLVIDEKGQVTGLRSTLQDITENKKAEELLRRSEKYYRSLFDNMLNGFSYCKMLYDRDIPKDFIYLNVNDSFETLTGLKNVIGSKVSSVIPGILESDKELIEIYGRVALTGKPERFEIYLDTLKMWLSVSVYSPEKEYFVAIFDVITERKLIEERIKESEARYRTLFEAASEGILIADNKTRKLRYTNPAICKMLGYSSEEMLEMTITDIHPKEVFGQAVSLFDSQEPGEKRLIQFPLIRKDGGEIFANISATTSFIDGKKCNIGFINDITELMESEKERLLLATAIDQIDEYILITDIAGVVQYINPSFEKITGYTRKEAINKTPRILKSGKHNDDFYNTLWDTILSGKTWKGHFFNKKKDGAIYEEEASISPIRNYAGDITNFVSVKRDVTNEVVMEQRFRESQKMEAIGTLAGGIAHDFNNILSAIIGYTELSLDSVSEDSQIYSDLTRILRAGNRARDLINHILTFSRQREQEKSPILITPIIKETLKLLKASLPSSIEIRKEIEPVPGTVLADPTQIHQVIMNLCTNAGHSMKDNGGILEVSLSKADLDSGFCLEHPGLVPGKYLELMVSDTGQGIAPEILPRIFDPYFTTKEKSGGTGLGLSVVNGIVTGCGGAVTVYSEPGKGSTFKVYLPIINENPNLDAEIKPSVAKGSERILFVDDEEDILDVGKRILMKLGYNVTTISSSIGALELFQKNPDNFDLVITDMTMPFMTGDEMASELMRIRQDIPIIVCTGYSEKLTEEKALSIGIQAYMGKPLLKSEMTETIRRVLDQHSEEI